MPIILSSFFAVRPVTKAVLILQSMRWTPPIKGIPYNLFGIGGGGGGGGGSSMGGAGYGGGAGGGGAGSGRIAWVEGVVLTGDVDVYAGLGGIGGNVGNDVASGGNSGDLSGVNGILSCGGGSPGEGGYEWSTNKSSYVGGTGQHVAIPEWALPFAYPGSGGGDMGDFLSGYGASGNSGNDGGWSGNYGSARGGNGYSGGGTGTSYSYKQMGTAWPGGGFGGGGIRFQNVSQTLGSPTMTDAGGEGYGGGGNGGWGGTGYVGKRGSSGAVLAVYTVTE